MFDFAWSELVLIAIVALIVIGPKDLPVALRGLAKLIKKMRRLAHEFQAQIDEVVQACEVEETKKSFHDTLNKASSPRQKEGYALGEKPPPLEEINVAQRPPLPSPSVTQEAPDEEISPALAQHIPSFIPPQSARLIIREQGGLATPRFMPPRFLRHGDRRVQVGTVFTLPEKQGESVGHNDH